MCVAIVENVPTPRGRIFHPTRASQVPHNATHSFVYIYSISYISMCQMDLHSRDNHEPYIGNIHDCPQTLVTAYICDPFWEKQPKRGDNYFEIRRTRPKCIPLAT